MAATVRHIAPTIRLLIVAVFLLILAVPSRCQTADDPVESLRQILQNTDNQAERDQQTKAFLAQLHTLSQLRKAVILREWRHQNANAELAAIDQANREMVGERFRHATQQVLSGTNVGSTLAALEMLNEVAASMRAVGEPPALTRPLTADVVRLVGDADPGVRAAAVRTLGHIDPDIITALPVLTGQAKSADAARRSDAASALHELLQATAQPWTATEYNPTAPLDRRATVESAVQLLPLVAAGVLDANREVRLRGLASVTLAATLLEKMIPAPQMETRDPKEVRPLAVALQDPLKAASRCLRDPHRDVKMQALKVLEETAKARHGWLQQITTATAPGEQLDDPFADGLAAALPRLADTLTDADEQVRRATLEVLERYGPLATAAAPAITRALKDSDRFVRWAAVRTLGAIGPAARPAIPALMKLLEDPDLDVRQATAAVLQVLDPTGEGAPKKPNQPGAAPRTALPALMQSLMNDPVEMRLTALHSLTAMGANAQPAVPVVAVTARDPDARVRLAAVQTLGAIGPAAKPVADALRQALKDDDAAVRKAAGEALLSVEREP